MQLSRDSFTNYAHFRVIFKANSWNIYATRMQHKSMPSYIQFKPIIRSDRMKLFWQFRSQSKVYAQEIYTFIYRKVAKTTFYIEIIEIMQKVQRTKEHFSLRVWRLFMNVYVVFCVNIYEYLWMHLCVNVYLYKRGAKDGEWVVNGCHRFKFHGMTGCSNERFYAIRTAVFFLRFAYKFKRYSAQRQHKS